MAEVYEEPLPVVVVPPGAPTGKRTLYDDPLPVVLVGGAGDAAEVPDRLGMSAQVLPDGADLDTLDVGNGWYFCAAFVANPFGDNLPAFLEVVNGGGTTLQRLTDVESSNVDQRVGDSNWIPLSRIAE